VEGCGPGLFVGAPGVLRVIPGAVVGAGDATGASWQGLRLVTRASPGENVDHWWTTGARDRVRHHEAL
jgi:hypothetical protein